MARALLHVLVKDNYLLEFDMDKIKAAGYSLETPVLITNHTDLKEIKNTNEAVVSNDVELIKVEF